MNTQKNTKSYEILKFMSKAKNSRVCRRKNLSLKNKRLCLRKVGQSMEQLILTYSSTLSLSLNQKLNKKTITCMYQSRTRKRLSKLIFEDLLTSKSSFSNQSKPFLKPTKSSRNCQPQITFRHDPSILSLR